MLSRASLGDNLVIQFTAFRRKVLRVARKASRSVRLSCALGRQRDAFCFNAYCKSYIVGFRLKRIYFSKVVLTLKGRNQDRKGVRVPGMQPALILADRGPGVGEIARPEVKGNRQPVLYNRFLSALPKNCCQLPYQRGNNYKLNLWGHRL